VLQFYPNLLPSIAGLSPDARRAVLFTQAKLDYNQGWLVQGESPPGILFRTFKSVLNAERTVNKDIAFYFVHWVTDLAGAIPSPLAGAEKFVLKFPHAVLESFLMSFPVVKQLADKTETAVFEDYLKMRWKEHDPPLGEVPTDPSAVAQMRIICMAQANAVNSLAAFKKLSEADRQILSVEMSRTACAGATYSSTAEAVQGVEAFAPGGPAFLVYYGPALLQNGGGDDECVLKVLVEVYREARSLYPLGSSPEESTVTIRVDTIKEKPVATLHAAAENEEIWLLVHHNVREAFVERATVSKLNELAAHNRKFRVLNLRPARSLARKPEAKKE